MEKIVVALIGQQLAGKDYTAETIMRYCGPSNVQMHSTGDMIRSILDILELPKERPDCSKMVGILTQREAYTRNLLPRAVREKIRKSDVPVQIFNSVRFEEDEVMVDSLPGRKIKVYVTAPDKERHKRAQSRRRQSEGELSFDQFMTLDGLPTELLIRKFGEKADASINNITSTAVEEFCEKHLKEYRFKR